ncbi:hypothetical protein, partial [uncultured Duncaniella sp.]|uniref:hypothetical protein n=1 Tax=uncultured Duncaniella sp. TaxID=2768039 RepID=UPI0025B6641A
TIDGYKNELNAVRNSYKQEIDSAKNILMDSIKRYNDEVSRYHNIKFEEYEKENAELRSNYSANRTQSGRSATILE